MGWLKSISENWSLKKSFAIYLFVFLIIGIVLAKVNSIIIEKYQLYDINRSIKLTIKDGEQFYVYVEQNSFVLGMLNRVLSYYKDFSIIIHSILFSTLGFYTYYIHKIKEPVDYMDRIGKLDLEYLPSGENELVHICKKIANEISNLQEEKIKVWNQYDSFNHMISSMSHDIRNPLAIIKGNVEILEMLERENGSLELETIQSIKYNLERIEKYLQRIDYLQSMEQLQIKKEKVSLLEFLKVLKNNAKILNSNKYIHWIIPEEDMIINIDSYHIQEAFENVLNNAITYSKSNIYINVNIKDNKMVMSIQDDGGGFSREALKYAFNKFYSENPQPGNMGLGLNITKSILKKHSGDLIIKNHNNGALVEMIINL